jgi:hypothetical protein
MKRGTAFTHDHSEVMNDLANRRPLTCLFELLRIPKGLSISSESSLNSQRSGSSQSNCCGIRRVFARAERRKEDERERMTSSRLISLGGSPAIK